jgi:hypothetical protein
MVAVQNTEDIHTKRILILHPARNRVFSGEFLVDKLCSPLVVNITLGRRTVYSSHLFLDYLVHTTSGEQAKILFKTPPVFIIGLEKLLTGSLIHPIKKVHIDCLVLKEKIVNIFLL